MDSKNTLNKQESTAAGVKVGSSIKVMVSIILPAIAVVAFAFFFFFSRASSSVTITNPTDGATASGTAVPLSATVESSQKTFTAKFYLDSTSLLGSVTCTGICSLPWDSTKVQNGTHTLVVKTFMSNGKALADSTVRNFVVKNITKLTIRSPLEAATVSGTIDISVSGLTDATVAYMYTFSLGLVGGSPTVLSTKSCGGTCYYTWNTTQVSNGTYSISVNATLNGAVVGQSDPRTITVNNPTVPDIQTIVIESPIEGATVSNSTNIVIARSLLGGSTFTLFVDKLKIGSQVCTDSSCTFVWNTWNYQNGIHEITVTATNSAGQLVGRSLPRNVTVSNIIPPSNITVTINQPTEGSTVSGTTNVTATSSITPIGSYSLYVDQYLVSSAQCNQIINCTFSWNTTNVSNATHILKVAVLNGPDIVATSQPRSVTVNNPSPLTKMIIALPNPNETVSGSIYVRTYKTQTTPITVDVVLTDPSQVVKVVATGTCDATECMIPWDTTKTANGGYLLSVKAYTTDTVNRTLVGISDAQVVNIKNGTVSGGGETTQPMVLE